MKSWMELRALVWANQFAAIAAASMTANGKIDKGRVIVVADEMLDAFDERFPKCDKCSGTGEVLIRDMDGRSVGEEQCGWCSGAGHIESD